jgi:hypothetical protein
MTKTGLAGDRSTDLTIKGRTLYQTELGGQLELLVPGSHNVNTSSIVVDFYRIPLLAVLFFFSGPRIEAGTHLEAGIPPQVWGSIPWAGACGSRAVATQGPRYGPQSRVSRPDGQYVRACRRHLGTRIKRIRQVPKDRGGGEGAPEAPDLDVYPDLEAGGRGGSQNTPLLPPLPSPGIFRRPGR